MTVKDAGEFKERATFKRNSGKTAKGQGFEDGHVTSLTRWAKMEKVSGGTAYVLGIKGFESTHRLAVRYDSQIAPLISAQTVVTVKGKTYGIVEYDLIDGDDFKYYTFTLNILEKWQA